MSKVGYWIDLAKLSLDDSTMCNWIQALPLGSYEHPVHGTIAVTPDRVQRFADNVNNRTRGTDLDIDYDHKALTKEAAGWVKQAEARPDGLWLMIEWTAAAYQKIKDKAYRYFSPEFQDTWTHPKTKQEFQDVLFGGGLTNRPFLKDILPINLSELNFSEGGGGMGADEVLKLIAKALGLPEDATPEMMLGSVQTMQTLGALPGSPDANAGGDNKPAGDSNSGDNKPATDNKPEGDKPPADAGPPQMSEAALKQLAESNPVIKQLMETVQAQGAALAETTKSLKLSEINRKLDENTKGAKYVLAPVMVANVTKLLTELPTQLADGLWQFLSKIKDGTGIVSLAEAGYKTRHQENGSGATSNEGQGVFQAAVKKLMEENKGMSFADAATAAAKDPDLYSSYQTDAYAFKV